MCAAFFAGMAQLVEQLSAILFRSLALSALLVSMRRQPKSGPTEPDYTQTGQIEIRLLDIVLFRHPRFKKPTIQLRRQ
jgi:hypothetical protein